MPRYTRCPYYIDESRKTISCEDVCRSFDSIKKKWAWMDMFCDSWDWMKCPYAADRTEAYRRAEEGDEMALDKQETEALRKEVESLLRKLGRANKRIDRQQKKIDELRMVNQSFTNINMTLERQNKDLYAKWRDLDSRLAKYEEAVANQVQQLADAYEARLAYMVDRYGTFSDIDVDEWRKDKSFALIYDEDDDGYPCWNVRFAEVESEDEKAKDED